MIDINTPIVPVTDEELDADIKNFDSNAIYEEDKSDTSDTPIDPDKDKSVDVPDETDKGKDIPVDDGIAKEEDKPIAPVPPVETPQDKGIDYKQRFIDKSKEEAIIYNQQQDIMQALTTEVPDPTQEQIEAAAKTKGLEYEMMTDTERILFKDAYIAQQKVAVIDKVREIKTKREVWSNEIDTFLQSEDVANRLKGREDAFKRFANQPVKIGYPSKEDLVTIFIATELPKETMKKGGSLPFTVGTGGKAQEKPEKKGAEEAKNIRKLDQRSYQDQVIAGKIDTIKDL